MSHERVLTVQDAGISDLRMVGDLYENYLQRVSAGELHADAAQEQAVRRFSQLSDGLKSWRRTQGFVSRLLGSGSKPPRGLYVHGSVGRGKTMLMDLFYESAQIEPKRRVHFHEFMADVHERIGDARKHVDGDPIPVVGAAISKEARLLCFDELHVTDIADAMILGRLFKVLFEGQTVVVATSNAHPTELYRNGLNRQLFLPFIDLISSYMDLLELDADRDFRLEKLSGRELFFTPDDELAKSSMDSVWSDLTADAAAEPCELEVKGRRVRVPAAAMGVARFRFEDICGPAAWFARLHICCANVPYGHDRSYSDTHASPTKRGAAFYQSYRYAL